MKHLLFLIIFCFSISCVAQSNYGAGVTHSNVAPVTAPNYPVKPSLIWLDSVTQNFFVNNPNFGWWLLMGPQQRYVRGFVNLPVSNYNYNFLENVIRVQQAATGVLNSVNTPLNGFYIVKFTADNYTQTASVAMTGITVPAQSSYEISHNDYFIFNYTRDKLISVRFYDDKTNFAIQQIKDSLKILSDTAKQHRIEIDSLKRLKSPTTTVINNLSCCDSLKKQIDTLKQKIDTFIKPDEVLIYAISPVHAGKLGVPMNKYFKAAYKNIMGVPAGTKIERMY
jgi:hypothetical protein